jgi:hypothetical protein
MHSMRKWLKTTALAAVFAAGIGVTAPSVSLAHGRRGFDDQYVFATTRALNDMREVNPALKVTLFPVTIVLDAAFLPFAVIAGFVT